MSTDRPDATTTAGVALEDIPGIERLAQVKTVTELLGFTVCAITERVCADAVAGGNPNPNVNAVLGAAINHVLEYWQKSDPDKWAAYLAENPDILTAASIDDL